MTKTFLQMILLTAFIFTAASCQKKEPAPPSAPADPAAGSQTPAVKPPAVQEPAAPAAKPTAVEKEDNLKPIDLILPKPQFVGTPENIVGVKNLEKPLGAPRPPFLAPEGTVLVSRGKPVKGSEQEPILGSYDMITDGDKEASDGSLVEMGPFSQWITIDLEAEYEIYAIVFWQYHKVERVYYDVIVQVSQDPEFIVDVVTLFNNDTDNSSGQGAGQDKNFVGTSEGKLIDARGTRARYVRIYSNGNNQNDMNHFIEVEVFGKSVK
ncbi:MAG TPA: discoidin domain-containing protein [Anaerohalosphaeraceae bacterium]|nr:discoidin domain-containing protein [Anaerohalosphaeraceae bacterium]